MDVTLAVLADYSNISREGKLNIMGIFDVIYSKVFPVLHPSMQLVMTFEIPRSELGIGKQIKVRLIDSDGGHVLELGGEITFPGDKSSEMFVKSHHIVTFNNLMFSKPGDYSFHVLVGGDEKRTVRLKLVLLQEQSF